MALTKQDIKKVMTDAWISQPSVVVKYGLTAGKTFAEEFSAVSIESILFDALAYCAWLLQSMFDLHRFEVGADLSNQKAHTKRWYANKALQFQLGSQLVPDQDYYDNSALTVAQLAASQIVKHAAVQEVNKGLRIKLAGESGGELVALTVAQLAAVKAYLGEIKDAGVKLYLYSAAPDSLKLSLTIYYNPLVLDAAGARLDGTDADPVGKAVRAFLKANPFDSEIVLASLVDALQKVDGVVIPHVASAMARYGVLPYQSFAIAYQPDAGYARLIAPADLVTTFLPHAPL